MAGNTAIGFTNYAKTGTLTATSSESGLGPTNLSSDQVNSASGWQTAAGVTSATLTVTSSVVGVLWRGFGLFNTNLTNSATITATLKSAGPVTVNTLTPGGPQTGYRQVVAMFDEDQTGDWLEILIADATNTDGHLNIGGLFAGPMWLPLSGITWDTTYGENAVFSTTRSRGGQRYTNQLYVERYWNLAFDSIRNSEQWDDLGELKRIAATGVNIMFVPDQTSVDINRETVFGVVETQADVGFPARATDAIAWRGRVTERL